MCAWQTDANAQTCLFVFAADSRSCGMMDSICSVFQRPPTPTLHFTSHFPARSLSVQAELVTSSCSHILLFLCHRSGRGTNRQMSSFWPPADLSTYSLAAFFFFFFGSLCPGPRLCPASVTLGLLNLAGIDHQWFPVSRLEDRSLVIVNVFVHMCVCMCLCALVCVWVGGCLKKKWFIKCLTTADLSLLKLMSVCLICSKDNAHILW